MYTYAVDLTISSPTKLTILHTVMI